MTHIVEAIIPLAGQPGALAFDGTHLWVVRGGAHVVSKIDPASGSVVDDIPVPPDPHDVYFDGRYLWVGSSPDAFDIFGPTDGRLTKIDPKSNTVVLSIPYTCSRLGAFDGQALWVAQAWTGGCAGSLDRIDPGNGAIIGGNPDIGPSWVDYDGTSIWVGYGDVGSIQQIDPATARVVASLDWRDGVYVPITFLGFFDGRYLWVPSGLQLLKIQMEH